MKAGLRLSTITFTLFMINSAIEAGHAEKVTFDEFYTGLDRQTLFEDVQAKLGEDIDLGLVTSQPDQKKLLLEMLESTRGALEGRERRKIGIERSGLLLFSGYLIEIVQSFGWDTTHTSEMDSRFS